MSSQATDLACALAHERQHELLREAERCRADRRAAAGRRWQRRSQRLARRAERAAARSERAAARARLALARAL